MRPHTLVDARTGIIRRLEPRPIHKHLPQALKLIASVLADTSRFGPWPSDPSGTGCAFWDADAATGAAIGEAVERYCGNLVPPDLIMASYEELTAADHTAVDPDTLALYSPVQLAQPGFPFVPFTRSLRVRWAQGRDLLTHRPVWVPASLIWVTWFEARPTSDEPRTNATIYAGIATGQSREAAEWSALCELIERDAMTSPGPDAPPSHGSSRPDG